MGKETARMDSQARNRRRADLVDEVVAVAVVSIFLFTAWRQELSQDAVAWKAWLFVTVMYLPMWLMSKTGR